MGTRLQRSSACPPVAANSDRRDVATACSSAKRAGVQFLDWYFSDDLCTAGNLDRARIIHVTRAERCLLAALRAVPGQITDRDRLLDAVAGIGSESSDRSIDVLINRLRHLLIDLRDIQGIDDDAVAVFARPPRARRRQSTAPHRPDNLARKARARRILVSDGEAPCPPTISLSKRRISC